MAGILGLKRLEEKKRALVAESEIYRETLNLEIQNLRLYGRQVQGRLHLLQSAGASLVALSSLARMFLGSRPRATKSRPTWRRLVAAALLGWRLYRQVGPILQPLRGLWVRNKAQKGQSEPESARPTSGA